MPRPIPIIQRDAGRQTTVSNWLLLLKKESLGRRARSMVAVNCVGGFVAHEPF